MESCKQGGHSGHGLALWFFMVLCDWFPEAFWQYEDDLLFSQFDPYFLLFAAHHLVFLLHRSGAPYQLEIYLQPHSGSCLAGKKDIWEKYSERVASSSPCITSFVVHAHAQVHPTYPPPEEIFCIAFTSCPLSPHACHSFTVMPRRAQRVFFGCKLQARSFATSAPAPRWVTTQQDAEMYGVFHVLRQTVLRKFLHVCEATDNAGVFYSVSRGRCSGQKRTHVRLLRKINRLCFLHNVQLQIARSEDNPADKYSRTFSHPEVFFAPAHRSRDRFAFTMSTCSLGRFLWLSPFPVMDLFNFVTAFLCWFAVADL